MSDNGAFKPRPDSGNLHAVQSKTNPLGKDYFGEIAINLKDMTNVRTEDGLTIHQVEWVEEGQQERQDIPVVGC
jgi:hypothetical protein